MMFSPWQWISRHRPRISENISRRLWNIALFPIRFALLSVFWAILGGSRLKRHLAYWRWKTRLPTKRKRALTAPLVAPSVTRLLPFHRQKSVVQADSALCTEIPFEVRERILEYAILGEGNVVHVFNGGGKFVMWRCKRQVGDKPCSWKRPCSVFLSCNLPRPVRYKNGVRNTGIRGWDDLEHGNDWGVLALLCSCRQIYTETITQVYAKLHFHLPFPGNIPAFASTILPSRLNTIRSLSFDVERLDLTRDREDFLGNKEIADTLSQMRGLRDLRMYFKGCWDPYDFTFKMNGDREQVRENFKAVKGLRSFEVVMDARLVDQYLPFWEGFWEQGTEARLVIGEELVEERSVAE